MLKYIVSFGNGMAAVSTMTYFVWNDSLLPASAWASMIFTFVTTFILTLAALKYIFDES